MVILYLVFSGKTHEIAAQQSCIVRICSYICICTLYIVRYLRIYIYSNPWLHTYVHVYSHTNDIYIYHIISVYRIINMCLHGLKIKWNVHRFLEDLKGILNKEWCPNRASRIWRQRSCLKVFQNKFKPLSKPRIQNLKKNVIFDSFFIRKFNKEWSLSKPRIQNWIRNTASFACVLQTCMKSLK